MTGATSTFTIEGDTVGRFYPVAAAVPGGPDKARRLPRSISALLESVIRGSAEGRVPAEHVALLGSWTPNGAREAEIAFVVNRVLLPDSTGVPLLVDLVAMRSAAARLGCDPRRIEPRIPVDLVIDHSVQIDVAGRPDALSRNMEIEFARNAERFAFIKWGARAFDNVNVVPPGTGICHQINLERIAPVVWSDGDLYAFDVMIGADSHTSMVNGAGVLGWGVGGIEAEAAMLGQPCFMLVPDVVGVELSGRLMEGVTSTDLVLAVTELLRKARVVNKFVEFFGDGAARLSVPERATLANMAPEYGATVGYFAIDERTIAYLRANGRTDEHVRACESYARAQGVFGIPRRGECDYSEVLVLDLATVRPSVAGPRRPQDRIALDELKAAFGAMLARPATQGGGYGKAPAGDRDGDRMRDGDVVLAAITSCTNTSNPLVMIAAGLLARNAVAAGLRPPARVKTSLAPGSRAVTGYLERLGLLGPLQDLGFQVAAYGCGSCLGNSGPLDAAVEREVAERDLVSVAVLSGNRNFEARVHPSVRANFLASPPLVIAFALAGTALVDFATDPLGIGPDGKPVFLRDVWPDAEEVAVLAATVRRTEAADGHEADAPGAESRLWDDLPTPEDDVYAWPDSTYVREPPFFENVGPEPDAVAPIVGARALAIFGDGVTTDHISPAGTIRAASPAGAWLIGQGVEPPDFNSFAARRSNFHVMARGTFGNPRIANRMAGGRVGPFTRHVPSGEVVDIYEAAQRYARERTPLIVFAGEDYGFGSSRDWAAKGPRLLGVRAVVARSYERIHRGNLIGLGIVPLQFTGDDGVESLRLDGSELFDVDLPPDGPRPGMPLQLVVRRADGRRDAVELKVRIDIATEAEHFRHGGLLPFLLRRFCGAETGSRAA